MSFCVVEECKTTITLIYCKLHKELSRLTKPGTVPYQVPQFLPILRGVRPSLCKKKEKIYCAKTVGDTSEFHDARIC